MKNLSRLMALLLCVLPLVAVASPVKIEARTLADSAPLRADVRRLLGPAYNGVFGDLASQLDSSGRPRWMILAEDFSDEYALTSNEPVSASSPWIGTALSSGTTAFTDTQHGAAILSGAATTDNTGSQIQTDVEPFQLGTTQTTIIRARFQLSDATNTHAFAGLAITDTTLCDGADGLAGFTATDGIGFYKPDDAATLYAVAVLNSAVVASTQVATLADATYITLELVVTMTSTAGEGRMAGQVNGVTAGYASSLTMPNDELLALAAALVSGNATGTKTMTLDYIGAAQTRSY